MRNLAFEVTVIDQRIKELHAQIAPLQEEISTLIKEKRDLIELIDQDIINNVKDGEKIPVMLEYRSSSVSYHAATKFSNLSVWVSMVWIRTLTNTVCGSRWMKTVQTLIEF